MKLLSRDYTQAVFPRQAQEHPPLFFTPVRLVG